jgi:hypothetical protein
MILPIVNSHDIVVSEIFRIGGGLFVPVLQYCMTVGNLWNTACLFVPTVGSVVLVWLWNDSKKDVK